MRMPDCYRISESRGSRVTELEPICHDCVPIKPEEREAQVVKQHLQQIQDHRPLAEDEGPMALLLQSRQHLLQVLHLDAVPACAPLARFACWMTLPQQAWLVITWKKVGIT